MAIVIYNDNGTIKVVKYGNYVVSTDADPVVQKEWVFLNGIGNPGEIRTFENVGFQDQVYANEGCANPYTLRSELDSQYPASGLAIGTQAAVRMNGSVGGSTCGTWALFEVQAV